jgi:hypothetical protein
VWFSPCSEGIEPLLLRVILTEVSTDVLAFGEGGNSKGGCRDTSRPNVQNSTIMICTQSFRQNISRTPRILILLLSMIFLIIFRDTLQIWRFRPSNIDFAMKIRIKQYNDYKDRNLSNGDVTVSISPPPSSPGRLFYCGWESASKSMFPEYDYQENMWNPSKVNSTKNDILVVGMYGPCLGQRRFFSNGGSAKIHKLFHGKILYLNGEAYGHLDPSVIDREYQIGPYSPPSEYPRNSLLVYFFAMSFGLLHTYSDDPISDWIFVPEKRRNNTGRYRGVAYFVSKCLKFRQQAARRISEIVPIYHGKRCKVQQAPPSQQLPTPNHTDNAIQLVSDGGGRNWLQNHIFFHDFKYCLVLENTEKNG